jgi:hypothetical protein|tara:strand:- start:299 stop:514 length:216 start_codon:yes stop_codon:yes gene_type:complete
MNDDIHEINGKALHWKINEATMILEWLSSIREEVTEHMPAESEIFEILGATSLFLNPRKEYADSITIENKG